jgi:hypothetical protein
MFDCGFSEGVQPRNACAEQDLGDLGIWELKFHGLKIILGAQKRGC